MRKGCIYTHDTVGLGANGFEGGGVGFGSVHVESDFRRELVMDG